MKTTKEKVLKAAKTSPEAKEALKELFPEAFEPEFETFEDYEETIAQPSMWIHNNGSLKGKGLKCSPSYKWSIAVDDDGYQVIQAVKK